MGAGHDGAAKELQTRLEARGNEVRIADFLEMPPLRIGHFVRWTYELQLRLAPWTYELTYRLWYLLPFMWRPVVAFDTWVTRRRMQRELAALRPDVVVSTYCLSSLVLGQMRKKGWLRVPVVTYLTDFAVHPLWVHPAVDLHIATSKAAAKAAAQRARGGQTSAPGPLVGAGFRGRLPERAIARADLGLQDGDRAVLVVAGSWGVGDVIDTVTTLAASGRYHPVAVCGRDEGLKAQLDALGVGTVLGWTDQMPALMSACDAVVENAGGLTCMEAYAAGLPVVTFHPIPGHGRENAQYMAEAGVNRYARDEHELFVALDELTAGGSLRERQVMSGKSLFAGDAADDVLDVAERHRAGRVLVPLRLPKARRRAVVATAAAALAYTTLTIGAQAVAALGVGIASPPRPGLHQSYLGVRLNAAELADPALRHELRAMHATAVIDAATARAADAGLRALTATGVDIANGGWGGHGQTLRWARAQRDVARASDMIREQSGWTPHEFAPGRSFDAFDQIAAHDRHQRLVLADHFFRPDHVPGVVRSGKVYVLDGRRTDARVLRAALARLRAQLSDAGIASASLGALR